MTNAEQFKKTFGIYAEEFWSYTEKQMLDWINTDVPDINVGDMISRQEAIDALHMHLMYRMGTDSNKKRLDDWINSLPSAQGKPFNLPEIYIADGYDTIEGEDGNVGFGVYVPDETKIYVAGDVEGEIRARALFHEVCHWVQAMCGRPFDEDEANEFSDIVYDALPSAQSEPHYDEWCDDCKEYDKERHCCPRWNRVIRQTLKDTQPEIIQCKDCKHNMKSSEAGNACCDIYYGMTDQNGFCHMGERRKDND